MKTIQARAIIFGLLLVLIAGNALAAATLNTLTDGGFEQGRAQTAWLTQSTHNLDIICDPSRAAGQPRSGDYWACLGHTQADSRTTDEVSSVSQIITIPDDALSVSLEFWLDIDNLVGVNQSQFGVFLDDQRLNTIVEVNPTYQEYAKISLPLPLSSYPPDRYTLAFRTLVPVNSASIFSVDDVRLLVERPGNGAVYLPLITSDFCDNRFSYNESVTGSQLYHLTAAEVVDAWDSAICSPQGAGVVVAIIDTGVDLDHPDLVGNLVPGIATSGMSSADDVNGHGTHVAGIVAAMANNQQVGGAAIGVAPQARIMPVNVLEGPFGGSNLALAQGIIWATDNGARVINLSLGSVAPSLTVESAIRRAYEAGVFVTAAAGNCGGSSYESNRCDYQDQPSYPAAYDDIVMAVAATDRNNTQTNFSTQGSYVDIAAPGSDIYSTQLGGGYRTVSGTSQATPIVSGLAALIWSQNPSLTVDQVGRIIQDSADRLGQNITPSEQLGFGLVDAAAALARSRDIASTAALPTQTEPRQQPPVSPSPPLASEGEFVPGELLVKLKPTATRQLGQLLPATGLNSRAVQIRNSLPQLDVQTLLVPLGTEQATVAYLRTLPDVAYAELNYRVFTQ